VRIGEFSKASGVPIKTLRFYEEIDVFRPAGKDPLTRYRDYAPEQLSEIFSLLALRDLGLPLREIKSALARSSAQGRRSLLERARKELQRSLDASCRSLHWIEAELRRLEGPPPVAVVLRRRPALRIASIRAKLGASSDVAELERHLLALVPESSRGGTRGTLWHHCTDGIDAVEAEHFVELARPVASHPGLSVRRLPAVVAACAYSPDDEDASRSTFAEVHRFLAVRNHQLAATKREIYRPGVLEIQFPIAVESR
jgi:DNA-binding transcriptional MerR regulator